MAVGLGGREPAPHPALTILPVWSNAFWHGEQPFHAVPALSGHATVVALTLAALFLLARPLPPGL